VKDMKKNYMKPVMCVVALQHKTHLLQASMLRSIETAGLDSGDELEVSQEGGGSNIWDR